MKKIGKNYFFFLILISQCIQTFPHNYQLKKKNVIPMKSSEKEVSQ